VRTFAAATQTALLAGDILEAGAMAIMTPTPAAFWGGYGALVIDGVTHIGLGDRFMLAETGGTLGGEEQGAEVILSAADADTEILRTLSGLRGAPVICRRLLFNATGATMLETEVRIRGRVDSLPGEETSGGEATFRLKIEGAARGAGRRGGRMRTDADQRLINGTDGGFRRISHAGEVTLYWGGKPPERASSALTRGHTGVISRAIALAQSRRSAG
jgi:formylmethanofuran dehydrogenase subunit C